MRRFGSRFLVLVAAFLWGLPGGAGATASIPLYQELAEKIVGEGQGVFARAEDGTVLVSLFHERAVHPASVSKVATTLAMLEQWGPDHRFVTRLLGARPKEGGIAGDLEVVASGNPFFLSDAGALVLMQFRMMGVDRISGSLQVRGPLYFNWKPDPRGQELQAALEGQIPASVWKRLLWDSAPGSPREAPPRGLRFEEKRDPTDRDPEILMVHSSPPLLRILKELNSYSNNIFHPFSEEIGGPAFVEQRARSELPDAWRDEVRITNAAGAGKTNLLSPRAAVGLLDALGRELAGGGFDLVDVLPVAGVDRGTLENRLRAPHLRGKLVGKTGTYGSLLVSSLAGVLLTERFGRVSFAILNHGLPVLEARRRQDAFVEALLEDSGGLPWPYEPLPSPALVEEIVVGQERGE